MIYELRDEVKAGIIMRMKRRGYSLKQICDVMAGTIEEYEAMMNEALCDKCQKHSPFDMSFESNKGTTVNTYICPRCGHTTIREVENVQGDSSEE